jgi:sterol desaturase/sphingolipid hydroxylase (fatty acid hydroxylase superfamily)
VLLIRCRNNFLILHITMAATALYAFPSLRHLPLWDGRGLAVAALVHVAVTEPLFYVLHRAFHSSDHLFACYHSLHHSVKVPQPFTGTYYTASLLV